MKFGIIGCQHPHIGSFINQMLKEGHELVGVMDNDPDSASQYSQNLNVPIMAKREELIAAGAELAGTGAIPAERIEILEWCDKNGIHLVSDKPLVINETGLESLRRIVNADRIRIGMILDLRYSSLVQKLQTEISKGTLGELVNVSFFLPHKLNPSKRPEWFFKPSKAGSLICDLMIHAIDCFRWFADSEIISHTAVMGRKRDDTPADFMDFGKATLRTKNGILSDVYVDWLVPQSYASWSDARIFCQGTKGFAELRFTGDFSHKEPALFINTENIKETSIYKNTTECINCGQDIAPSKPILMNSRDILKCAEICIAMEKETEYVN